MGTTKLAGAAPLLVFFGAFAAFAGWIAYDSGAVPDPPRPVPPPAHPADGEPGGAPVEALLAGIHPGVPRQLIERRLMPLPPPATDPIDLSSGAAVLRSRYHLRLECPPPPHLMPDCPPHQFRPGLYVLTLEFDAHLPDHPLRSAALAPAGGN